MLQHGGYRDGAGRPKGAKNKRTLEIDAKLQTMTCPFEGVGRVAQLAEAKGDLAVAGRMYAELASYVRAKPRTQTEEENTHSAQALEALEEERDRFLGIVLSATQNETTLLN